jgi:hypothetical protein
MSDVPIETSTWRFDLATSRLVSRYKFYMIDYICKVDGITRLLSGMVSPTSVYNLFVRVAYRSLVLA